MNPIEGAGHDVHAGSTAVRIAASTDKAPAVDTVVLAFAADPVARWSWPHGQQYLANMPRLVSAFGGRAFDHGSAHCTDAYGGVALWLRRKRAAARVA